MCFDSGKLLTETNEFEIATLEVYACGGDKTIDEGLRNQHELRENINRTIDKARKVDRAKLFNNDFNKEMFFSNTFSHNKNKRGES